METILAEINCVCRFCLCEGEDILKPVRNILDPFTLTVEDIKLFTGVQIVEENRIPYSICEDCYSKLNSFASFRTCCLSNDVRFKELFAAAFYSNSQHASSDGEDDQGEDLALPGIKDHIGYIATYDGPTCEGKIVKMEDVELDDGASISCSSNGKEASEMKDNLKIVERGKDIIPDKCGQAKQPKKSYISNQDQETFEQKNGDPEMESLKTEYVDVVSFNENSLETTGNITDDENNVKEALPNENRKRNSPNKNHSQKQLCPMCGKMVLDLSDHMLSHNNDRKHVCQYCSLAYGRKTYLKLHVEAVHLKKVVKTCEICNREFTQRTGYEAHMRAQHNIGKWYECKQCNMQFRHPGGLREHNNRKHNASANCSCPVCGMEFQSKVGLKNHSKVHSSVIGTCKYCPKRFKSAIAQKRHELTHFGVTFSCTFCTKSYRYSQNLVSHMRKHKGS